MPLLSTSSRWWRCSPHGYVDPGDQTTIYVFEHFGGTFTFNVLLLALGLTHSDMVHCSRVDPEHPVALSNYLEARGFPFAWLATANGTCGEIPGVPGRVLWNDLLRSFAFWAVVATVGGFLLPRRA